MKYICANKDCTHYGVDDEYVSESYVFQNGELIGKHKNCPYCGKPRKEINPAEQIPLSEKNICINRFNGANKEQKIEMLKKRSHEHFQKEVKERKDGLLNQAMSEMRAKK